MKMYTFFIFATAACVLGALFVLSKTMRTRQVTPDQEPAGWPLLEFNLRPVQKSVAAALFERVDSVVELEVDARGLSTVQLKGASDLLSRTDELAERIVRRIREDPSVISVERRVERVDAATVYLDISLVRTGQQIDGGAELQDERYRIVVVRTENGVTCVISESMKRRRRDLVELAK